MTIYGLSMSVCACLFCLGFSASGTVIILTVMRNRERSEMNWIESERERKPREEEDEVDEEWCESCLKIDGTSVVIMF